MNNMHTHHFCYHLQERKKQEVQTEAKRLVAEGLADREFRAKAVEERQKALKQSWALKGTKLKPERGVGRPAAAAGGGGRKRGHKGKGHRNSRADEVCIALISIIINVWLGGYSTENEENWAQIPAGWRRIQFVIR